MSKSVILQPDDFEIGQIVGVHSLKLYPEIQQDRAGFPYIITWIEYPFVVAKDYFDSNVVGRWDTRYINLMKLSKEYCEALGGKIFKPSKDVNKKKDYLKINTEDE